MTSCIVGKKIRAMGPGPLGLFPFVVLAIVMAMAGGISEHMLTSWSSLNLILCLLCKMNTLWNILMILSRNVEQDEIKC